MAPEQEARAMTGLSRCGMPRPRSRLRVAMTNPDRPSRTTLSVSEKAHASVKRMQARMKARLGYRVTQSEAVIRGMEALEREQENGK